MAKKTPIKTKPQEENTSSNETVDNSSNNQKVQNSSENTPEKKEVDLDKIGELINLIINEEDVNKLKDKFYQHVAKIFSRHPVASNYLVLFLYDENNSITEKTTDRLYNSIPNNNDKPILLIIHSKGGEVEPAYLISKTCKEKSPNFVVAVPRRAKSAATLIALGANEIHMGSMSELGPIDPQFGNLPALGLSSSLESIAKVVSDYPKSSDMFAKYLSDQLNLRLLGYFERVSESAQQYAQRLLEGKTTPRSIEEIAHALVYEYKDHSFVIDKDEAKKFLGDIIKVNTDEYRLANEIHKFMGNLNWITGLIRKKNLEIIGQYHNFTVTDLPEKK
jgi:ClpP class serine protease